MTTQGAARLAQGLLGRQAPRWTWVAGLVLALLAAPASVTAQVRVTSPTNKHNLSVTGPGPTKAVTVTEICVFCHTPHNAVPALPLWNQTLSSGVTYQTYTSTTMAGAVGLPTGSSKLCLSCHDGTVALGKTVAKGQMAIQGVDAQGRMAAGASMLGTDLRNDHPISFVPVTSTQIVNPPPASPVKLDANGQMQCRSCHDPHRMDIDTTTMKFLVASNSGSGLCVVCHQKTYWTANPSTHRTSTKAYTSTQGAHTGYATVQTNGCESCHKPHTAAASARTLKAVEEATCGTTTGGQCHGSTNIGRNIAAEFLKTYRHPTYTASAVHDATESPTSGTFRLPENSPATARHAECPDCHNPHASYAAAATAPNGSGKLAGVWGVDSNGSLVQPVGTPASVREYEICYKCHADSANKPQQPLAFGFGTTYPNRQILQFNMRLMFDPANPSFHPVEGVGKSTLASEMPSLYNGWSVSSRMYCTDCHGNDTGPKAYPAVGTGPAGPHGSNQPHLLVARYDMGSDTTGFQSESAASYALCYKCHSRTSILGNQSFTEHNKHIVGETTPCSLCHDPHGISSTQAQLLTPASFARLINFDRRFVTPSSSGILRFEDTGLRHGRCYLTCHGENHNPLSY